MARVHLIGKSGVIVDYLRNHAVSLLVEEEENFLLVILFLLDLLQLVLQLFVPQNLVEVAQGFLLLFAQLSRLLQHLLAFAQLEVVSQGLEFLLVLLLHKNQLEPIGDNDCALSPHFFLHFDLGKNSEGFLLAVREVDLHDEGVHYPGVKHHCNEDKEVVEEIAQERVRGGSSSIANDCYCYVEEHCLILLELVQDS